MYDLIFSSPTAKVLDTLSVVPNIEYSTDELTTRCNLSKSDVKIALERLEQNNFVKKTLKQKYQLLNNTITNAFITADIICRRENNDSLHNLFENADKQKFFKIIK